MPLFLLPALESRLTIHTGMRAVVFIGGISDIFSVTSMIYFAKMPGHVEFHPSNTPGIQQSCQMVLRWAKTLLWSIGVPNSGLYDVLKATAKYPECFDITTVRTDKEFLFAHVRKPSLYNYSGF